MYEQKHWDHQEKLLIERQMRNMGPSREYDSVPVSSLNTRLFVDVPRPSIPDLHPRNAPDYDDIYEEISPIGSVHSVLNSTQPIEDESVLEYTEEQDRETCADVEENVGVVNGAMTSFTMR